VFISLVGLVTELVCVRGVAMLQEHVIAFFRFMMNEDLVEAADLATMQLHSLVSYCDRPSLTHFCLYPRSLSLLFMEHYVSSNSHV
jgi:hypothetical protein